MRKNFRFGTVAMAAMIAASMAMSSPVVSHAEELDANSDVGDVLDNIFGQDKPAGNPDDYADAPTYEGGIEVGEVDWSTGGLVDPSTSAGTGTASTLPAVPSLAVKVTDPDLAAQFPAGALYAATPENTMFFHSISNDGLAYNVWFNGVVGDQFAIADAAGKTVAISNPDVLYINGKCYVSVTVPAETQGAHVVATEAQKSAFTRLFSVDGVMVNGVLVEEFQDTVQN